MASLRFVPCVATVLATWMSPAFADEVVFSDGFDPGFRIETPELVAAPGEEVSYCYYFRVPGEPGDPAIGVRRWSTRVLGTGIRRMNLFAPHQGGQPVELEPPGSLVSRSCWVDIGLKSGVRTDWVYSTNEGRSELVFPGDDGAGAPVAAKLQPGQPVYLQVLMANETADVQSGQVLLDAETLGSEAFTPVAPFVAFKVLFKLPPAAVSTVSTTCQVPSPARFSHLTTQTRRYATLAEIRNGVEPLVTTTDWEHPAVAAFGPPAFLQFPPAGMTLSCTYDNTTNGSIGFGESEVNDELCVGVGYYFPAERSKFCIEGTGPI